MTDISKRYHHGDLRRALVTTGLEMLAEPGGWQFTLRELARRAGVSHTASYKHFPDKAGLLAELALMGFDRLRTAIEAARPQPRVDPRDEFLAMCRGYIRFGVDNPNLYRLVFSADARQSAHAAMHGRAVAALDVLTGLIEGGQRVGWLRPRAVLAQAAAVWAQLHGITLLAIDDLFGPDIVGSNAVDAALAVLLEGIEAAPTAAC
jgi:AcrR family transcriptional regulator